MNIPATLDIESSNPYELTCPDQDFYKWKGQRTSAQYYVNPAGTPLEQACTWGKKGSEVGNFSPMVSFLCLCFAFPPRTLYLPLYILLYFPFSLALSFPLSLVASLPSALCIFLFFLHFLTPFSLQWSGNGKTVVVTNNTLPHV